MASLDKQKQRAAQWNSRLKVSEYTERRMTFGKYLNYKISDLPENYLRWGALNLNQQWSEFFLRELRRRNPNLK